MGSTNHILEYTPCLCDRYGRNITYLRVSLTELCNFHCIYCCPDCEMTSDEAHSAMLLPDILRIMETAGKLGFEKVRLTGGEPLMRKDIVELVKKIRQSNYFRIIAMTTNGSLLTGSLAADLCRAGLTHLTISLNTLDRDEFRRITGVDALDKVIDGIAAASMLPFKKIKINMVVFEDTSNDKIELMRNFCNMRGITLQTIKEFSLSDRNVSAKTIIATDRPSHCNGCNRIRLTSNGFLRPCLFDDAKVKVDLNGIEDSIRKAVFMKPENGGRCERKTLKTIGG